MSPSMVTYLVIMSLWNATFMESRGIRNSFIHTGVARNREKHLPHYSSHLPIVSKATVYLQVSAMVLPCIPSWPYRGTCLAVFLFLANYRHFSTFKNSWLPIQKGKRMDFFLAAKWTWISKDGPKGIRGWFGFSNLNPKGFVIVAKMRQ
jgi:hypothetical protein